MNILSFARRRSPLLLLAAPNWTAETLASRARARKRNARSLGLSGCPHVHAGGLLSRLRLWAAAMPSSEEGGGASEESGDPREKLFSLPPSDALAVTAAVKKERKKRASPAAAAEGATAAAPPALAGTPEREPAEDAAFEAWAGGMSVEMRRLLRAPRYFDTDFEAVRLRRRSGAAAARVLLFSPLCPPP